MNIEPHISEEAAAEVWRRAAQLQAEAEQRLERRRVPGGQADPEGLPVAQVEAAAAEAGIAPEFVRQALAEVPLLEPAGGGRRAARLMLGRVPHGIQAERTIAASPAEVLAAVQRVLPAFPYRLALAGIEGDPAAGGVVVFEVMRDLSAGRLQKVTAAGARLLHLRMLRGSGGCRVRVSGELTPSLGGHNSDASVIAVFTGAGGALTVSAGAAALTAASGALLLLPAFLGMAAAGAVGVAGYRAYFRRCVAEATRELEAMLATLEAHIRTGGAFGLPAPGAEGSDDSTAAVVAMLS